MTSSPRPFLLRFAQPIPDDGPDTSPHKEQEADAVARPRQTSHTFVHRETTDDN